MNVLIPQLMTLDNGETLETTYSKEQALGTLPRGSPSTEDGVKNARHMALGKAYSWCAISVLATVRQRAKSPPCPRRHLRYILYIAVQPVRPRPPIPNILRISLYSALPNQTLHKANPNQPRPTQANHGRQPRCSRQIKLHLAVQWGEPTCGGDGEGDAGYEDGGAGRR